MSEDISFDSLSDVDSDEIPESLLVCPECGKSAKNKRGLSMHMKRSHGEPSETASRSASRRASNLEKELQEFFMMIAMFWSMFDQNDGAVIGKNAPMLAHAYANLARKNKYFKKLLEGMMDTGAIGEVITATFMTVVPIAINHGKLPNELGVFFGAPMTNPPFMEQG